MNPCFSAVDIVFFTDQFFDHDMYFSYFFHMNLTFPFESQKTNKHEVFIKC